MIVEGESSEDYPELWVHTHNTMKSNPLEFGQPHCWDILSHLKKEVISSLLGIFLTAWGVRTLLGSMGPFVWWGIVHPHFTDVFFCIEGWPPSCVFPFVVNVVAASWRASCFDLFMYLLVISLLRWRLTTAQEPNSRILWQLDVLFSVIYMCKAHSVLWNR